MSENQILSTDVNLKGLLDVLGENLYSTPVVCIRELIQNAHDACVRRKSEANWQEQAEVKIKLDSNRNTLTIEDNGSGLTQYEITQYLATIGSGYTRVMRNKTQDEEAVGYFGLGFLTAFVIGEKVEFITQSYQEDTKSWHYISNDGQTYTLNQSVERAIGSRIILHLKKDFLELLDKWFLQNIIKKYCCLLPIKIYLDGSETPTNDIEIPWDLSTTHYSELRIKKSSLAFAQMFDGDFEPVIAFPINGSEECAFNGLLWIQDGAYYASTDNRVTTVFIRKMHVTDDCKTLLPEWAGFFGCVIDTSALTPTASRESVQDDSDFSVIKEQVHTQLIQHLVTLAQSNDPAWDRVITRHNQNLLGAAVSDNNLFEALYSQLSLPTSEGELKISEILARSENNTIQISMDSTGGFEQLIAKSMGIPVVYGYRFAASRFCQLAADKLNFSMQTIGSEASNSLMFPEESVDQNTTDELIKYFNVEGVKTQISRFEPKSLPLIQVFDQDAILKKRIESDEMKKQIGLATLMLASKFTDDLEVEAESHIYLNINNPLIQKFSSIAESKKSALALSLVNIIQFISGNPNNQSNSLRSIEALNENLTELVLEQ